MCLLHFRDLITTFTRPRRVNVTLSPMGLVLSRRLRPALITISICAGPGAGIPWIPGSGFRSSSLPVSRGSRGRDSVGSGVLVFRSSGVPGVPGLGFRGFQGSGVPVFRSSGVPGTRCRVCRRSARGGERRGTRCRVPGGNCSTPLGSQPHRLRIHPPRVPSHGF